MKYWDVVLIKYWDVVLMKLWGCFLKLLDANGEVRINKWYSNKFKSIKTGEKAETTFTHTMK